MPPNNTKVGTLAYIDEGDHNANPKSEEEVDYNQEMKWHNVVGIFVVHVMGLYGLVFGLPIIKLTSFIYLFLFGMMTAIGITAGVHRLWTHRSYKAKLPLRILLMLFYATAGQNSIKAWVLDHRVHHKYSETPADPHNAARGLFYAHVGWLMKKKHPSCYENGKKIDMSDIYSDPVVQFHDNNFLLIKIMCCFVMPTLILRYIFLEGWWMSFYGNIVRYVITLNGAWTINSFAHAYGDKPYDKSIGPSENIWAAIFAYGEGWHNYHHTFPWDYRTSETGLKKLNVTAMFIDFFAWVGWAYDLKTASKDMVLRQAEKKGDGTRFVGGHAIMEATSH